MTTDEIRRKYLEFFKERGHAAIPRANLVPQEDATTLFTGSGMQPLLPYLLGERHPAGQRLVDSQTCFRAEDIDEVGDNRHITFFEMLGNWSLGDYFKREQLAWFFEFLVEEGRLEPSKLYVTCFAGDEANNIPRDEESAQIWQGLFEAQEIKAKIVELVTEENAAKTGMQGGRIFYYDASKNWWSRAGVPANMPEGEPGGPDSEVFYDFGTKHDPAYDKHCHPNCDCGRFLEIGNSVFMQYVKTGEIFNELPQKNVDFGGGLERIAAAHNGNPDVFKIDLLWPIIEKLQELSGKSYTDNPEPFRVIADHVRSSLFMAVDGVNPSNTAQGYVLRRLMRRAIRQALTLEVEHDLMQSVVPIAAAVYHASYPEVAEREAEVLAVLKKEEATFRQTLRRGLREFEGHWAKIAIEIDAIASPEEKGQKMGHYVPTQLTGELLFKLYDTYGFPIELSKEEAEKKGISVASDAETIFEKLMQTQKDRSRTATNGQFKGGLGGEGELHRKYHTATHLMYRALREVLGDHVVQRGSNVTDERTRFDFAHPAKMTDEEKAQVEKLVNERISQDLAVTQEELPTQEALKRGAYGAFGDKYGETVKVYSMKDTKGEVYSFEICGGPHVEHTVELAAGDKRFRIKKEESSSAGVRRIKAVLE